MNTHKMKKTLYEILGVSTNASIPEIQAAQKALSHKLQSGKAGLNLEDTELELKLINLAFETLSKDKLRADYDAKLRLDSQSALRNETTNIRTSPEPVAEIVREKHSPLRMILIVIATLMAAGISIQLGSMLLVYRQLDKSKDGHESAEEKVILQEYYQENGVRPGSRIEADLWSVEKQKKLDENRRMDLEKTKKEREYQRFIEESRRVGDQVSADMERARENARMDAENKKQQEEQERLERQQRY